MQNLARTAVPHVRVIIIRWGCIPKYVGKATALLYQTLRLFGTDVRPIFEKNRATGRAGSRGRLQATITLRQLSTWKTRTV